MSTEYYTAEEAMKVLKKPRSTFFKDVEKGLIPSELEEGRKRGRHYPKQAIDALARRANQTRSKEKGPSHFMFAPSTTADSWTEVQIGLELYGEDDIVPFETLLDWKDVNDEMYMSVKDKGQLIGYSSLMPIQEDVIISLIHDKIQERDIPAKAIRQWTEPNLSIYIATLTVKPSKKELKSTIDGARGSFLLKQTIKWALSLNRQHSIKNWYGIGATKEGQHLFEALGFKEIVSLYGGERKGYYIDSLKEPVKVINNILESMRIK
ncbi:MAG: helix-turn-helix domain-containing protein [Chloroflexi bacterium]|nr:MAG: helix-turn-helix domain-containing protein [Chloroflexota bacterium]